MTTSQQNAVACSTWDMLVIRVHRVHCQNEVQSCRGNKNEFAILNRSTLCVFVCDAGKLHVGIAKS